MVYGPQGGLRPVLPHLLSEQLGVGAVESKRLSTSDVQLLHPQGSTLSATSPQSRPCPSHPAVLPTDPPRRIPQNHQQRVSGEIADRSFRPHMTTVLLLLTSPGAWGLLPSLALGP